MSYLNKYCLIHETQSRFRQKHSCQTALVELIDQWMACIDKVDIVWSIFIDFRKAFDLVDHRTLIRKLSTYKCSQSSLQWFISYLESRQQTIDYGHGMSLLSFIKNSKWVWSGNTTITNRRQPCGTARKSRSTITRHQEDKLSKATSSSPSRCLQY